MCVRLDDVCQQSPPDSSLIIFFLAVNILKCRTVDQGVFDTYRPRMSVVLHRTSLVATGAYLPTSLCDH